MYVIRNIKVSVKIDKLDNIIKHNFLKKISVHNNFIVVKNIFTYILFKPKKLTSLCHLNITKIKCFSDISQAIAIAKCIFKGHLRINTLQIDNITATTQLNEGLQLSEIYNKHHKSFKLKYNNDVFPGLHCKLSFGSVILFHSGKLIFVGCKSSKDIENLINQVQTLIH